MSALAKLPTLQERPRMACPKGVSRSQMKDAKLKTDDGALEIWRSAVFARDKYRCRHCGGKVVRSLRLLPNRAEANHIARRAIKEVRTDVRNGLNLCRTCHERVTGKVDDKLRIIGTRFFTGPSGATYIDATYLVRFEKVV